MNVDPMSMLQMFAANNPAFNQIMQAARSKNTNQLQNMVRVIARQKGMTDQALKAFLQNYGLKL